jgi:hypothetical protein
MRICLGLWLLLPFFSNAQEQSCDILLLKKGNKTVAKYFSGNYIAFYTTDGMPVNGTITCIKNDSIFLIQFQVQHIQTPLGGIRLDTSGRYRLQFSLANIGSFPAGRQRGKNLITDGRLFMVAGAGYLAVNLINTTRQGQPPFGSENLPRVLASSAAVLTGFLLSKSWPNRWTIGRRYSLKVLKSLD